MEEDEFQEICKEGEILSEEEKCSEEDIEEVPEELSAYSVTPAQSQVSKLTTNDIVGISERLRTPLNQPNKFYTLTKPELEAGAFFGDEIGHREWLEHQKLYLTKNLSDSAREKMVTLDWKCDGILKGGLKSDDLDAVIRRLALVGLSPQGYNYPEFFQQCTMPKELQEMLVRKQAHYALANN